MSAIKKPMPVVGTATKALGEEPRIKIVPHRRKKRNSFRVMAVKAITIGAFLINIYSIMLMEFHPRMGLSLFGITFLYELAFLKANGGL